MSKLLSIKWLAKFLKKATNRKVTTKPDVVIGGEDSPYLRRWWLIPRNRFFNIYLHEIVRSDDDRALHDHPWWNVSFILDGTLKEIIPFQEGFYRTTEIGQCPVVSRYLETGNLAFRKACASHRLEVGREKVRTLFITGPRVREWGFHCPQGWRHWKIFTSYDETGDSTRVGRGCGEL